MLRKWMRAFFVVSIVSLLFHTPVYAAGVGDVLTVPWVSALLLIIGVVAVVVEIFTPTFGIAGGIGFLAFVLYFYGGYIRGAASMIDMTLFAAGILLLFLETLLAGFGIVGITGLAMVVLGILLSGDSPLQASVSLFSAVLISVPVGMFLVRRGYKSKLLNRSVLSVQLDEKSGFVAKKNRCDLLEKQALTLTPMRPSGRILIDDIRYDALTGGEYIESGEAVVVYRVSNGQIFVRRK